MIVRGHIVLQRLRGGRAGRRGMIARWGGG